MIKKGCSLSLYRLFNWPVIITLMCFILMPSLCKGGFFGSSDETVLREKVEKYWNSKLTGDLITCYQLEEPKFQKKVPISQYVKGGNIIYKEIKVDKIKIEGENATATINFKYIIPALGSRVVFSDTLQDEWVKLDGKWYHHRKIEVPKYKRKKLKGGD